jgi:hypothetical protein
MLNSLTTWFGGVTTGHGVMILAGTLLSVFSGGLTWSAAAPLLTAGVIGLIWPENAPQQPAGQAAAAGVAAAVPAYNNKAAIPPSPPTRV